jgi:hypothetical protein
MPARNSPLTHRSKQLAGHDSPRQTRKASNQSKISRKSSKMLSESLPASQELDVPRDEENFRLVTHYQPLLFAGFHATNSLIVVERPWLTVLDSLPPAFARRRFGT